MERITEKTVSISQEGKSIELENDYVYIFAGGELPTTFLENAGVQITKRFGHIMKKHK